MTLDLIFQRPEGLRPATAYVVLNGFSQLPGTDIPCLTADCLSMGELEEELKLIEMQVAKIRAEAKKRFLADGIPN